MEEKRHKISHVTPCPFLQNPSGLQQLLQDSAEGDSDVSSEQQMHFGEVRLHLTQWLSSFFLPCKLLGHETCCVFLQGGCGEGCTQGLPGVPGMAVAKGENGDLGKPGVTPLDSCDMVRPQRTGKTFSAPLYDSSQAESCDTLLKAASLCSDECKMAASYFASHSCCMAWLEELSVWCDTIIALMLDSFLFSVFQCLGKLQATQPAVSSHWR